MPILLRPMAPPDLPALLDLWVAAWQATLPATDFAARRGWMEGHLAVLHAGGATTLCACAEGQTPSGFITFFAADGLVEQLAVHPDRFGAGLGTALLEAAKRRRPQGLHLLVNQENPRAVAFYRRAGFAIIAATTNPDGRRPVWRMAWPG
ncbi:MAG: hypothetical protein BGP12_10480 [Rhodospirillales bacterium 70-18]|nr:MAG: hypothetical protein BGP12_10480 [Rhodospirillales bacterium 70-18]